MEWDRKCILSIFRIEWGCDCLPRNSVVCLEIQASFANEKVSLSLISEFLQLMQISASWNKGINKWTNWSGTLMLALVITCNIMVLFPLFSLLTICSPFVVVEVDRLACVVEKFVLFSPALKLTDKVKPVACAITLSFDLKLFGFYHSKNSNLRSFL